MKKLLFILLLTTITAAAQTQKEVDLSIKHYDILQTLKKNPVFKTLESHDKMIEHYDKCGQLEKIVVKGSNYEIIFDTPGRIRIIGNDGLFYNLIVWSGNLIGHGVQEDRKLNRLLTYFLQNDKVIKESVIKF